MRSMKWYEDVRRRIFMVVGLFLLVVMVLDFNNRIADLTRLRAQQDAEQEQFDSMVSTQSYMETQIAYATSEVAVEDWARQEHYDKEGDYPVIPLPDPDYTPSPEEIYVTTPEPMSNWDGWMLWLFGRSP